MIEDHLLGPQSYSCIRQIWPLLPQSLSSSVDEMIMSTGYFPPRIPNPEQWEFLQPAKRYIVNMRLTQYHSDVSSDRTVPCASYYSVLLVSLPCCLSLASGMRLISENHTKSIDFKIITAKYLYSTMLSFLMEHCCLPKSMLDYNDKVAN